MIFGYQNMSGILEAYPPQADQGKPEPLPGTIGHASHGKHRGATPRELFQFIRPTDLGLLREVHLISPIFSPELFLPRRWGDKTRLSRAGKKRPARGICENLSLRSDSSASMERNIAPPSFMLVVLQGQLPCSFRRKNRVSLRNFLREVPERNRGRQTPALSITE
jgi:hypothetical protein